MKHRFSSGVCKRPVGCNWGLRSNVTENHRKGHDQSSLFPSGGVD
ncbi:hypothetical protein KPSA3_07723 [Pseudomonas syringae pv. actinidiae]|uniref:Uncharacterized protein n=1 Tax=Pseudomonas syringae pv. actinidiae TaxID=103796 RepID=A0AAN4QDE0_PSESF|nr:hypothetical protein KPSA3_07723 [Pseudomonas syringae pv. actinidiae]